MTYPVKAFMSTDAGAPALNGTPGSLIAVLDACLITGYNIVTLDSITRSGSTATATKSTGHGFNPDDIVLISGAGEEEYNGEVRVTGVTSTTFTFEVEGEPATPASGTITAKRAPLGWTKAFSGSNKAAYTSSDPATSGCLLRVDDTNAQNGNIVGYRTMSDVDTGTGMFPTTEQRANGLYVWKSSQANATARDWILVGDGRLFYLLNTPNVNSGGVVSGGNSCSQAVFGDFISFKPGDAGNCLISGSINTNQFNDGVANTITNSVYGAVAYTQAGSGIELGRAAPTSRLAASGRLGFAYPNPADNALLVGGLQMITESAGSVSRGLLPGMHYLLQEAPLVHKDRVTDIPGLTGKTLLFLAANVLGAEGRIAFDVTGPWR